MYTRSALVQRIVRNVTEGVSVSVVGRSGSGRSELVRQVAEALDKIGLAVLRLRGIEETQPLEAFRVALPNMLQFDRREVGRSGELARVVSETLSEGPAVVMVDDIDLLDDASWVLLEQAHQATGVPIVGTSLQRGEVQPGERVLIRKAHPVVKVELDELPLDAVHDLLEARLGDQVSPSLSGRIHMKSGGLPGFVIAIADAALRQGRIRKQGHVWHDTRELWSDELEGPFEALLYRYPVSTREALEILAAPRPIALEQAIELVGQHELEMLEEAGLVRLVPTGEAIRVTVDPPGIRDYFNHRRTSVRSFRLRRRADEVLGAQPELALSSHPQVPRQFADVIPVLDVPQLTRAFRDAYDGDLARTWSAWLAHPTVDNAVAALNLRLTGDAAEGEIEQLLADTNTEGAEAASALRLRYLHARWLVTTDRSADEIEAAIRGDGDLEHPRAIEALLLGFDAERFEISPEALTRISALAAEPGLTGDVASLIATAMHALGGDAETALLHVEGHVSDGWMPEFGAALKGFALMTAGRPQEALAWASQRIDLARHAYDRVGMVAQTYVAVMSLLTMSRYADATAAGSFAATGQLHTANLLFSPDRALMNALALAARRSGRAGSVGAFLERGVELQGRSDGLPMGAEYFPAALVTEIDGDAGETGRRYRELAESLFERGYRFSGLGCTVLALLIDFDINTALVERERLAESGRTVFLAYLDARIALHHKDAPALVTAARWLRKEHANDSALKHFTAAARIFRDNEDEENAEAVREEIAALMASSDPASEDAVNQLETNLGFTHREREIIDLVAEGKSNPEIADELVLSVRTVETHLRNVRRKSGALNRAEIGVFASGL